MGCYTWYKKLVTNNQEEIVKDERIRKNIIDFFKAHPDGIIEFG